MAIQGTLHVDRMLTNYVQMSMQDPSRGTARRAAKVVPVENQSDKYRVYDDGFHHMNQMDYRAPGTSAAKVNMKYSTDNYSCIEKALDFKLPDEEREMDDLKQSDIDAGNFLVNQAVISEEVDMAAIAFATSGYWDTTAPNNYVTPAVKWDQPATATPIKDFDTWMNQIQTKLYGVRPNKLFLARDAWTLIKHTNEVKNQLTPTGRDFVTEQIFASWLGLDEVVICDVHYNSAVEGQTATPTAIVSGKAFLCYQGTGKYDPTALTMFVWKKFDRMGKSGVASIRRWRNEDEEAEYFRIKVHKDIKVTNTKAGILVSSITT